ncbi:MAG: hypothetical protein LOD90_11150, partial [Symbiobacteriaceae bacterium]
GVTGSGAGPARRGDLVRSGRPPSFRTWWALFRVQLKVGLPISPSALSSRPSARLGLREWLLFFLVILSFLPLLGVILAVSLQFYGALAIVGQPEAMLTLFFVPALVLSLVFGLVSVVSTFFFARDLPQLVSLPLPAGTIVSTKLAVVVVNQWLSLSLLVPPLAVYGLRQHAGLWYWLKAVAVWLLLPVPTLALAAVLAMGLMRVAGRTRQRDWAVVAGSLLAAGVAIAAQVAPRWVVPEVADPSQLGQVLPELVGLIGRYAPPAVWATRALAPGSPAGGTGHLLLLAGTGAAGLAIAWWVANRIFARSLAANLEAPRGRRARERVGKDAGLARVRPAFRALLWREWTVLWRTPVFAMNTLLPLVLVPLTLGLSWWMGNGGEVTRSLGPLLATSGARMWSVMAGVALTSSAGLFGVLGATAISREGRAFWLSQVIPVAARDQVAAKLLFASGVAWLGGLPMGVALGFLFRWTPALWAYWLVTGALGIVAVNALQLAVDLWQPKLDWTDPHGAVKQNFNVLLAILAGLVSLGGAAGVLYLASPGGPAVRLAAVFGYLLLLAAGATWLVLGAAERAYR